MIVTIDGPAAAGKSTAARMLAERLGFDYLDTGAMYRAVALAALQRGIAPGDEAALERLAATVRVETDHGRVLLDGVDVTRDIRSIAVTRASRFVADSPSIRRRLVELQRQIGAERHIVTEGRDQGTVVFPDADCKVFLTAEPAERARRRHCELAARGERVAVEDILRDQQQRDANDAARRIAPMVPAPDAMVLDSTGLSLEEVVDRLERRVRSLQSGGVS